MWGDTSLKRKGRILLLNTVYSLGFPPSSSLNFQEKSLLKPLRVASSFPCMYRNLWIGVPEKVPGNR